MGGVHLSFMRRGGYRQISKHRQSKRQKMDKREHAPVDISKLADSLTGKFKTFYPLSQECCIYRVHQTIRRLNPSDYTPQIVSIGPLHHGKEELEAMEEHKIRYLQHFLQRTEVSIQDFLALIKKKEVKLRMCYPESIDLGSDDFVKMILVDAVFLIEFCLRGCEPNLITNDDRIFGKLWTASQMLCDLWLVENQIPLFILNDLFNLAKTATYSNHYERLSIFTITSWFLESVSMFVPIENKLFEINLSEVDHFLDLLILCIQPTPLAQTLFIAQNVSSPMELQQPFQLPTQTEFRAQNISSQMELQQPSQSPTQTEFGAQNISSPMELYRPSQLHTATGFKIQKIHSATELHQAGVKFKLRSSRNLLDITFNEGILEIPFLTVFDNSERFYRNIVVFEGMHGYTASYFNDYVIMMSYLVNTAKDAELLIQNRIIGLGNEERLSTVFHSLVKDCSLTPNFQYSGLVENLRIYCDNPWHKWKATLTQDYFHSPWASMSVIAAVVLLVLTFIQAVCSIVAL